MKLPLVKLSANIIQPYIRGLHLGTYTYLFSNILDHTISRNDTLELINKNPKLYIESTVSNFINLIGLSPIYYIFADNFLLKDKSSEIHFLKVMAIVLTHNILFYKLHKTFHEVKKLYFIHKFHHRFIKPIPSNGNAVSVIEYNIAYVLPFLIGAIMFNPNNVSFQFAIGIISFLNSLVHCFPLRNIKFFPLLVVPNDHLIHHEKLTSKYASPLLNVDNVSKNIKNMINNTNDKYRFTKGF